MTFLFSPLPQEFLKNVNLNEEKVAGIILNVKKHENFNFMSLR